MSEKVKVSMFLEPDVARAVKMQAARQGAGVSEIVRNVFLCAHCREPITDDFIVGAPKLIAPDKYGVFYHRKRKEYLAATVTKIVFLPLLPTCEKPPYQRYERTALYERLQNKAVRIYYIQCDTHWPATQEEAGKLSQLLADGIEEK